MFQRHRNDLTIFYDPPNPPLPNVLSVGWLVETEPVCGIQAYDKHDDFVLKLSQLFRDEIPFTNVRAGSRGWFVCIFDCEHFDFERDLGKPRDSVKGIEKILIPGKAGLVYCAPGLILHYITAHGYKPPAAFVDAVMAIGNGTHFNGHVYDIQICRYTKGLPLYTYEELVRIGFIEDGDPEPWWVDPEGYTISEVLEPKTTSAAVGAASTRYELDQLEKQHSRQLWEAVSVGSKTGKSLACGERVSPESIAEAINKLKAASRTLPGHRSTAIILGRIYRYANNSQPVGLHAAISVLSETIAALRQSGGSTKDEADLFYNRACYYWLLSKLTQDNREGYLTKCIDDLNESIFLHPDEETKTLRRRYLDKIKVEPFPEIDV